MIWQCLWCIQMRSHWELLCCSRMREDVAYVTPAAVPCARSLARFTAPSWLRAAMRARLEARTALHRSGVGEGGCLGFIGCVRCSLCKHVVAIQELRRLQLGLSRAPRYELGTHHPADVVDPLRYS